MAKPPAEAAPAAPPPDDDQEILATILAGTASATGEQFFKALVRNVSIATRAAYAFVAELSADARRVRTLALFGRGRFHPDVEYELAGTPCEDVIRGALCHHPREVQRLFPQDTMLVDLGIQSYLGVPLLDNQGQVLGHLAVLDTQPMPEEPRRRSVFQIFAARAAAELERLRIERRLVASEQQFRLLFEEAPIGYVYEDTETRFVSANRTALQILGLRPDEVKGTVGRTLVAPTPESQQRLLLSMAAEQAGKERESILIELRRKSDGRSVWVQRYSRPDPDGKFTRTMILDVTAQVQAQAERNQLRQQNLYLHEELKSERTSDELIGTSSAMRDVMTKVQQVAPTDSTVLLLGETGVGKERIARALHASSRRHDRPLIKLNCAALPSGLIESELFGHEKGAFTGATEKRVGRFALADGGTIFLDEIGDMPMEVQVRLLRVLQEQEFEPVGGQRTIKVDVRVIAATNRDLEQAIADGSFRRDLYYRLAVFPIVVPPLRERTGDVPILVHYFAAMFAQRLGKPIASVDDATMAMLTRYSWPGNIRELQNVIERAIILATGPVLTIDPAMLPAVADGPAAGTRPVTGAPGVGAKRPAPPATLAATERAQIEAALVLAGWRIEGPRGAAKRLGLHPNTRRSRLKKLGIERPHGAS